MSISKHIACTVDFVLSEDTWFLKTMLLDNPGSTGSTGSWIGSFKFDAKDPRWAARCLQACSQRLLDAYLIREGEPLSITINIVGEDDRLATIDTKILEFSHHSLTSLAEPDQVSFTDSELGNLFRLIGHAPHEVIAATIEAVVSNKMRHTWYSPPRWVAKVYETEGKKAEVFNEDHTVLWVFPADDRLNYDRSRLRKLAYPSPSDDSTTIATREAMLRYIDLETVKQHCRPYRIQFRLVAHEHDDGPTTAVWRLNTSGFEAPGEHFCGFFPNAVLAEQAIREEETRASSGAPVNFDQEPHWSFIWD